MGGDLFFAFEDSAANAGELVGILAALAILLLAFGSFVATALPIGMAVLGLAVGVGAMPLLGQLMVVPSYAPVLGAMVGLGVGIDYALFVVTRHREHLARGVAVDESIPRAVATAGRPVVFAGGIVVVSILGLAVAGVPFMTAGGVAIALVVLVMVAASVTLLPALLAVAGPTTSSDAGRSSPTSPGWARWTRHVTRHPRVYAGRGHRRCSSRSPPPSSPCASASPTTARCRRAGPSGRPTTSSRRASGRAATDPSSSAVERRRRGDSA